MPVIIERLHIDRPFEGMPPLVVQAIIGTVFLALAFIGFSLMICLTFFVAGMALWFDLFVERVYGGWRNVNLGR